MKAQLDNFPVIAGTALGFVIMAFIGWEAGAGSKTPSQPALEKPMKSAEREKRPARRYGPSEEGRKRIASIRGMASSQERMRATIAFANWIPASEIGAWMDGRWFGTGEGFDLTLFNKILKERWKNEDPVGMLAWSAKNNSSQADSILTSWAEEDPRKVVDFFAANPNKDMQARLLSHIADKNPAAALKCLLAFGEKIRTDSGGSYYYRELFKKLAAASTDTLEACLASLSPALKAQAESAILGKRLETSFSQELQKLWNRPDGWKLFYEASFGESNGGAMGDKIFDQLASLPPDWKKSLVDSAYNVVTAANYAKWWNADLEGMGFTDKQAKRIREYALGEMARKQPAEALKLITSDPDLSDGKSDLIRNLFGNLSTKDADKVESLIASLGTEEDRKIARDSLRQNSESAAVAKIEKPADWLAKIGEIDPKTGSSSQYFSMIREWDQDKYAELGNQFRSMPGEQKMQAAQIIVSNGMSNENGMGLMADAIRYLVSTPAPATEDSEDPFAAPVGRPAAGQDRYLQKASSFAVQWSRKDPAAASAWVRTLPAGEARSWAQKNLVANWTLYDPEEAHAWVRSLPANEQTEVKDYLKSSRQSRE